MHAKAFTHLETLTIAGVVFALVTVALPKYTDAELLEQLVQTAADMKAVDQALHQVSRDYSGGDLGPHWACSKRLRLWDCDEIGITPGHGNYNGWLMIDFEDRGPRGISHFGTILTTPIAYLKEVPMDPFNSAMGDKGTWHTHGYQVSFLISIFMPGTLVSDGQTWEEFWMEFLQKHHPELTPDFWFYMTSAGPDAKFWCDRWRKERFYSPTNGLRSAGDIWRFSNGKAFP